MKEYAILYLYKDILPMDILEENLFKNGESKEKADVETEVLFKNASAENLAYEEPSDNKSGFDVLR